MTEEKKEDSVEKLEKKIDSLEGKFDNFLTNHFAHLVENVETLMEQNTGIKQSMEAMEKNILKALGARAYDWSSEGKGIPETRK